MNTRLKVLMTGFALLALPACVWAADAALLKPPPGAKVAVVVFEDLECPDCARLYPVIWEVAQAHHVPVVLHDFPLPRHPWSFDAAVYARFFDTRSVKLGNDFRGFIYKNQPGITPQNLRQYVQKFGDDNKVPLPFAVDPEGKLKEKVLADYQLGQRIGIEHTPTIFVVSQGGTAQPFVEVADREKLSQTIEDMQKKTSLPASKQSVVKPKFKTIKKISP